MKKFYKIAVFLLLACFAGVFAIGCSSSVSGDSGKKDESTSNGGGQTPGDSSSNTDSNTETKPPVVTSNVYISLATGTSSELVDFTLSGTETTTGEKVSEKYPQAPEEDDLIEVPVGTYKFVLTAKKGEETWKGECEVTVVAGENAKLSFTLSKVEGWTEDETGTESGNDAAALEEPLPPVEPDATTGLVEFTSLSADDISKATYSEDTTIKNVILKCNPTDNIVVDSSSATVSGKKYKNRIKLSGTGNLEKRNITIYVGPNREGLLTVYLASANKDDANRPVMANSTELGKAPISAGALSGKVKADENGYIAIYSSSNGINIYGIEWKTGSAAAGGGTDKINPSVPVPPVLDNSAVAPSYKYGRKVGMRSNIRDVDTDSLSNVIFVAPNGKLDGEGTKSSPLDLQSAIDKLTAGGVIVLKGGTYKFSKTVRVAYGNNGTESAKKYIMPETGNTAVFDYSGQPIGDSERGFQLEGDYWHIFGITVYNAGDNGMYVTGKHNIIERCIFQANQDTGLQIARRASTLSEMKDWPANNLILNCTSFDNKDDKTGENADGFAAKLTCGEGNIFDGCISYANCDDGWDLYAKSATGSIGVVTIRNCVAFQNGKTTTGENYANGDMNGFKLGGSNNAVPTPHVVTNCAAFKNGKDGFTDNGNGGALDVSDCTSYGNVNSNMNFYRTIAGGKFKNLVCMNGSTTPAQVDKFGSDKATVLAKIQKAIFCVDKKKGTFLYQDAEIDIKNGDKPATATAISDPFKSELKNTTAPEIDLDVDAKCRNVDGTINLDGFLEMKEDSVYKDLGAHFGDEAETVFPCGL